MKYEKQRAICEFFGNDIQLLKADEELDEINGAFEIYVQYRTNEALRHLTEEAYDLINVLEGLCVLNGVCLHEIKLEKDLKLDRCISIINQINPYVEDKMKEYDKIRYKEE